MGHFLEHPVEYRLLEMPLGNSSVWMDGTNVNLYSLCETEQHFFQFRNYYTFYPFPIFEMLYWHQPDVLEMLTMAARQKSSKFKVQTISGCFLSIFGIQHYQPSPHHHPCNRQTEKLEDASVWNEYHLIFLAKGKVTKKTNLCNLYTVIGEGESTVARKVSLRKFLLVLLIIREYTREAFL